MGKNKIIRIIAISLLLFTGINAIVAGLLFIIDPSGARMGMTPAYLEHSPFHSFLVPGIVLLLVNGVFNIIAAGMVIKKSRFHIPAILLQGLLLGGWILIQVLMVRDLNPLHLIMLGIGLALLLCGWLLNKGNAR